MNPIINKLPFELELRSEIEKQGILKVLPKDTYIAKENEYIRYIPLLVRGRIRVYKEELDLGREILLYYVNRKETCMMSVFSIFQDNKSQVNGITMEESEIILIPIQKVREWQLKYPSWNEYLITGFSERYSNLLASFTTVSFYKIDDRLNYFLKQFSKDNDTHIIPFSHQKLANELGTTRVVISRLLKKMESQNLLSLHRGYINLKKM